MPKRHFRTSYLLVFILSFLLSSLPHTAQRVDAQTLRAKKVTISIKSASIGQFLTEIRQQTGMNFVINVNLENTLPKVNVNIENKTVDEALDNVLTPLGCSYEISNRLITIYKKTLDQSGRRRLSGVVMDDSNEPLPGATVQVVGTTTVVVADIDGRYSIDIPEQVCSIRVSYAGMNTQTVTIGKGSSPVKKNFIMISDNSLNEVVVTGIFENKRELYTGSASTFNKEQLAVAGNRSLLSTLQNLDPSFHISEDISIGSDPNALPSITIRGASALPTDVQDLQVSSNNLRTANQPLFILDGFEIPLSRFMDLDESMVESITILKDANGTALYGSKGSNGVVVITSKRMNPGKLMVSYKGTLGIEAPDLTSYNLM
ncbi:MAG: carboxypeptidase-like regulatory domain-containing protein, partial [Prevotella sp.]|nr:carboxypeptidase-like regulatory domain-containing protein [Prevotella sp.]